ncbi:MAG: hypothetical protein ACXAAN_16105 [Candidatus Thorarchaeota archaeon]
MQLDLMQVLSTLLAFSLVLAIVIATVTGWPESKLKYRFEVSFYLSLLGLFSVLGSGLLMYFEPWSFSFHYSSMLWGVVLFGMAFPSYLVHKSVREETDESRGKFSIIVLHKSARNSLAVALAAVVSFISFVPYNELLDGSLFLGGWLVLVMILVTHNISTVYYLRRQHTER